MKFHPACELFPETSEEQQSSINESVAEHGQREPIVMIGDLVLDGRSRLAACKEAGIAPFTRQYDPKLDGPSPLRFAMETNFERRHLTPSQRASVAVNAIKIAETEAREATETAKAKTDDGSQPVGGEGVPLPAAKPAKKPTTKEAAQSSGASVRSTERAKKLEKDRPDLFARCIEGEMTIAAAEKLADKDAAKEKAAKERPKALKSIRANIGKGSLPQDFYDAVERGSTLKKHDDLTAFAALDIDRQTRIAPLLSEGWSLKQAIGYTYFEPDQKTTIKDLINVAIAERRAVEFTVDGWLIACSKPLHRAPI